MLASRNKNMKPSSVQGSDVRNSNFLSEVTDRVSFLRQECGINRYRTGQRFIFNRGPPRVWHIAERTDRPVASYITWRLCISWRTWEENVWTRQYAAPSIVTISWHARSGQNTRSSSKRGHPEWIKRSPLSEMKFVLNLKELGGIWKIS